MKKQSLLKMKAMLLAASLSFSSLTAEAKIQDKDVILNEALEEYEEGTEVEVGTTTYKSDDIVTTTVETSFTHDSEVGDIVEVNGIGKLSSDGTGNDTKLYKNVLMVVVGVKSNSLYPYALAPLYSDGTLGEVTGWFKRESILSKINTYKYIQHADVKKEIIHATQIGLYYDDTEEAWKVMMRLPRFQDYEWLGDWHGIRTYYEMPEIKMEYDYSYISESKNGIETIIYVRNEEEFTYYYDYEKGILYSVEEQREQVEEERILARKYGIKNE